MPKVPLPPEFAQTGLFVRLGAKPPERFQVMGERSSGTNLLHRLVLRNTVLDPSEVLGWKHGFPGALAVPSDLAVICAVRGPEAWALSMFAKPWHTVPEMQQMTFSDFLRAPWQTTVDRARYFSGRHDLVGQPLMADRDPVTGQVFANLLALRRAKLRALLSYLDRGGTCAVVRTETLQDDPEGLIARLKTGLGLPVAGEPFRGVTRRLGSKFKPSVASRPALPTSISEDDRAFIRANLDPELESALGYSV